MALYMIGDVQGCFAPLQRLLQKIDFSPSRDTLYFLGDLVNRGPDSLGVLRHLGQLGNAAQCLLGNHDLHLLAMWEGVRQPGRRDTAQAVLQAPDAAMLMDWLRHRAMAIHAHGWLMVHAGVLPTWSLRQTLALAAEVEAALRGPDLNGFLSAMYGNTPDGWQDKLKGPDRLRVIVNALTRLRFCTSGGQMEFSSSEAASGGPAGHLPWFAVPGRATAGTPIAFGHWSTLFKGTEGKTQVGTTLQHNTLPLDTGCVWGGCLTAARLTTPTGGFELISAPCEQSAHF
ncbi:MAG: symmetrical bis(5'-nucleosyl)-tetraphosphatase [Polaromonas sp.]|nr:symmetrical bis(5'-nucleosyl)-tetraphosphatase [Polaromonas sp.]